MKLTDDAKQAGRLWSVRLAVLSAALGAIEATLPLWQDVVPAGVFAGLSSAAGVSAAVARVIRQEALVNV